MKKELEMKNYLLGWFVGEINTDCDVTCKANNLVCTEYEMWKHNSDVDAPEKLAKLLNGLLMNTNFTSCSGAYGEVSDVPLSTAKGTCLSSSPGRSKEKFDCGLSPTPKNQRKKRLCFCHDCIYIYIYIYIYI